MPSISVYIFCVLFGTIHGNNITYWSQFKQGSPYKDHIECGKDPTLRNDADRRCLGEYKVAPTMFYFITPPNVNGSDEYYEALRNEYLSNCKNWQRIKGCALRFTKKSLTICAAKVGVSSIESAPFRLLSHKMSLALQDAYCADQHSQKLIQFLKNGGLNCTAIDFLKTNTRDNNKNPYEIFSDCVRPFGLETFAELKTWTRTEAKKCVLKMLAHCPSNAISHALPIFKSVVESIQKIR